MCFPVILIDSISKEISNITGVRNLHHVHAWQLDDHKIIFEAHIDLDDDISISKFETKLVDIKQILLTHGIDHSNIQPEFNMKDDKALIHKI